MCRRIVHSVGLIVRFIQSERIKLLTLILFSALVDINRDYKIICHRQCANLSFEEGKKQKQQQQTNKNKNLLTVDQHNDEVPRHKLVFSRKMLN